MRQKPHDGENAQDQPESTPGMIPGMVDERGGDHQRESDPAERHVAVAGRRRQKGDHREQRFVFDAVDDGPVVIVDGHGRVTVAHPQMPVDDVRDRTARIFGLDENARHHLERVVFGEMGGYHVPRGAQVHILFVEPDVGQRRRIEVAVAHILQPVRVRIHIHFVVADRELVGPALHRIGLVAVQHDVVGQVIEIDPVLVGGLQGQIGITLGDLLPLVQGALHPVLLAAKPRSVVGPDIGKAQDQDGHKKDHLATIAYQDASAPSPKPCQRAHS